ncbi:hypothetical protein E6C60_1260 [Paenibacillus algicola]|uniref:Uncharacterized protein n=1 Tax=Paenibacillus algicola TaxID=2565926 RepID=A0A4P8XI40_9BACL|nr:hypothetical protein E6C60_1260 [Paenibacillus algicola]
MHKSNGVSHELFGPGQSHTRSQCKAHECYKRDKSDQHNKQSFVA